MTDEATNARMERLLDVQEITEVLYRYAAAVDRLDADRLATCFHPDATDDHGLFAGPVDEFVPWVMGHVGAWVSTQHDITNPLVDVRGDRATSECHWNGWYRYHDGDGASDELHCGRYVDRFERRDGVWRIAHRTCVTDWSRALGSTRMPIQHRLAGRRDQHDLSYHSWDLELGYRVDAST
ncbi:nuclear transport factor 2 family protein [Ilumatobacter coccineus]|uniref:SnoaL-like domain-containing protein n=1 Tax=Ilumatobacter coccineus (strain NBRC 103263 / KCTC 29153 / YM16-304) TaxID=1313172 RepID=A0A6C7E271_ILUCY|nr:nuclear transport factor 2 family protein [Ilumatobacter coccineus]BAN00923.1 hypothetical protein YM304_06090 [Ilumatobacter coccineus YM16-304]